MAVEARMVFEEVYLDRARRVRRRMRQADPAVKLGVKGRPTTRACRHRADFVVYWRLVRALAGPEDAARRALHETFRRLGLAPLNARWPGVADDGRVVVLDQVVVDLMRRHAERFAAGGAFGHG